MSSPRLTLALATALAAASLAASGQQPPSPPSKPAAPSKATPPDKKPAATNTQARDAFKGRLKPGLYELLLEADMGNMPNVPKDKAKHTQKMQQCMSQQDVDKGMEDDPNCPMKSFASAGNQISVAAVCKDGSLVESKLTFTPAGYTVDIKYTAKQGDKTFNTTQKMTAKYVGPCPAPAAPAAPAKK